ncbi:hypothetical protein BKA67DRAFT_603635 [Truncatella angustata]|uniref:tyrosinase n=1 Tax=Truncatella angustata TaxID=152316 RepID=A0A9P8ZYD0_9PEZI|nr:uncharacterized protein BKA67DRAFT_603635 [Truncatella angustata]KAH6655911.1 hypothetical protein BKA67DRAFT_603635 [Truncatella angustata]
MSQSWDVKLPWQALGGDKRTENGSVSFNDVYFKTVLQHEGGTPFNILHSSYEDAIGMDKFQTLKKKVKPTGPEFAAAPQDTTFDGSSYDLDARFVANVKLSPWVQAGVVDSPEYQLIALLGATLESHQTKIQKYFSAIQERMNNNSVEALTDYLTLAETRRRIYRPLPLDEFGYTLPYAKSISPDAPFMEMKPDGTIGAMPARGQTFLNEWTNALGGIDPELLPKPDAPHTHAPVSLQALPRPNRLAAVRCQGTVQLEKVEKHADEAHGCPYFTARPIAKGDANGVIKSPITKDVHIPNWTDDILPLIRNPSWCKEKSPEKGAHWISAMKYWSSWSLDEFEDVKKRAVSIHQHLRSKTMPITRDPQDYWPDTALETFRNWANAGFPKDSSDFPVPRVVIPKPQDASKVYGVRRDIMSLSKQELAIYQSKLDDVLQVSVLGSKWQELGLLHTEWCLHYQEATFLWHRAFLLYIEKLIDYPIPYWNGFSIASSDPTSADAGIPRVFLEETYIHPKDGSVRPNPLKYALALDGKSKSGKGQWVTRDPTLVEGPSSPDWQRKISLFSKYHEQITQALQQKTFTSKDTQEGFGIPWANIPTFSDDQPDSLYPYRLDFDGLFEQVHDNYHGWVGPDMADNTYTAFDPIFLSYHANMDRLAGVFLDAHPDTHLTSNYPLQPFIANGTDVAYDDPRRWIYTTIGDMAKDTRAMGYMYGAPTSPDAYMLKSALERGFYKMNASGGRALSLPAGVNIDKGSVPARSENHQGKKSEVEARKVPFILFRGVGCTEKSYRIDVFTHGAKSTEPCAVTNSDFIGQVTRLGMGPGRGGAGPRNTGRCRKPVATRVLQAQHFAEQLATDKAVKLVVTRLDDGQRLAMEDYSDMTGFEPRILWLPERN